MMEIKNLKLSMSRFSVSYFSKASFGLHFIRCLVLRTHEDVVTDHLLVSEEGVRVLDTRE
jgi:hypothetical protein